MRSLICLSLAALLVACAEPDSAPPAQDGSSASADGPAAAPVAAPPVATETDASQARLDAMLAGEWRLPENRARDIWRHPRETLGFFGVRDDMRLIEITPGAGWYTEILAPWLRERGDYTAVLIDPELASSENARDYYLKSNQAFRDKLAADTARYDRARLVEIDLKNPLLGEPGSADAVLTFRNVHNWINAGAAPAMFKSFFDVLKPGGMLGVVEHRANADVPEGDRSGYMSEAQVIRLATEAGFVLEEKSEINANPADTKDHPNGVWTLPPANRHEPADAEKYAAIGESDRMTLRFRKPG